MIWIRAGYGHSFATQNDRRGGCVGIGISDADKFDEGCYPRLDREGRVTNGSRQSLDTEYLYLRLGATEFGVIGFGADYNVTAYDHDTDTSVIDGPLNQRNNCSEITELRCFRSSRALACVRLKVARSC